MLLKDFIKETLVNITQGVEEANKVSNRFELSDQVHSGKGISGTNVAFEVGVIANDSTVDGGNAGISVQLASVFKAGAGVDTKSENFNQSTHNLKFQVFISEKE